MELNDLKNKILKGDRLAVSRAMTWIENEYDGYRDLMDALHPELGRAYRIGVTGPPGAGKSTFTNQLTKIFRKKEQRVGIIAIDPTSPFSGGAILGDRVRMSDLTLDRNVFIRSMATRGSMGGLARQATEVADILDAAGFDIIIYETVGVGQVELDIAEAADTTLVMIVPEGGDIIQGMKAGLMEIGDLFLLNKADRPGADRLKSDIEYVLHLKESKSDWYPGVFLTISNKAQGIVQVAEEIEKHRKFQTDSGILEQKRNHRLKKRVETLVEQKLRQFFWNGQRQQILNRYLDESKNNLSPYKLAEELLGELLDK